MPHIFRTFPHLSAPAPHLLNRTVPHSAPHLFMGCGVRRRCGL